MLAYIVEKHDMSIYFVKKFFFYILVVLNFHIILIPKYFLLVIAFINRVISKCTFKLIFDDIFNNYKFAHIFQVRLVLKIKYLPFLFPLWRCWEGTGSPTYLKLTNWWNANQRLSHHSSLDQWLGLYYLLHNCLDSQLGSLHFLFRDFLFTMSNIRDTICSLWQLLHDSWWLGL